MMSIGWRSLPLALVLAAALAGCGGGGDGERDCGDSACVASNSVAVDRLEPSYYVYNDGESTRAHAAFSTDDEDVGYNVVLDGGDRMRVRTVQGVQDFEESKTDQGTYLYVSELVPPTDALAVAFEFERDGATYTSRVTLPRPFTVTAPSTLPVDARQIAVQTSTSREGVQYVRHPASFVCTDSNGNEARSQVLLEEVGEPQVVEGGGEAYALHLGGAIDALEFGTSHPPGTLQRCDVELSVVWLNYGEGDSAFAFDSATPTAQQVRRLSFSLE